MVKDGSYECAKSIHWTRNGNQKCDPFMGSSHSSLFCLYVWAIPASLKISICTIFAYTYMMYVYFFAFIFFQEEFAADLKGTVVHRRPASLRCALRKEFREDKVGLHTSAVRVPVPKP